MTRVPISTGAVLAMGRSRFGAPTRVLMWAAALLVLLASVWLDPILYHMANVGKDAIEWQAWYQVFRGMGTLWFWGAAGLAVGLVRRGAWRRRVRAAIWVFAAAVVAGLLAEALKALVGRERPILHDGSTVFRSFSHLFWSTRNLSFPSSHAAVALGGAWMVWRLRGSLRGGACIGVLALVAAGVCGASRMLTGAHFFGDIVGAAIVGAVGATIVHRLLHPAVARRWPVVCLLRRRFGGTPGAGRSSATPGTLQA